jgi:hypothetical protein
MTWTQHADQLAWCSAINQNSCLAALAWLGLPLPTGFGFVTTRAIEEVPHRSHSFNQPIH